VALVEGGLSDFAVSVREVRDHPSWMWRIDPVGELGKFDLSADADRRQLLEPLYVPNGSIYAFRCEALMHHQRFIGPGTRPIVMNDLQSIDIDTEIDFEFAEFVFGRGVES
jgi:N-acylneuraminate cytidylyltransferase/CMP-N,N'-diacetyllegionaminic acid synthase